MISIEDIELSSLDIEGIMMDDYPDFCDAYFSKGMYKNGIPLSDDDLIELTDTYPFTLHEMIFNKIY
jgi:hypothetical protein